MRPRAIQFRHFIAAALMLICYQSSARIHYVNWSASGANNGTSWANAFTNLSTAIDVSTRAGDTFWVAKGTYTSTNTIENWSFHLLTGTVLYGGFEGTETALLQRNWVTNVTILSGTNTFTDAVVKADCNTGRIDGFTITHSLPAPQQNLSYGVIASNVVNITIENCIIKNLAALHPVAIGATNPGTFNFINCQFLFNGQSTLLSGSNEGSALYLAGANLTTNVMGCRFANNDGQLGGAIYLSAGSANVSQCVFLGNNAVSGGALYGESGSRMRVFNSLIIGNRAGTGCAFYSSGISGYQNFTHCTIADNRNNTLTGSTNYALYLNRATDTLRNCIIWGDSTGSSPELPLPATGAFFRKNVIKNATGFSAATQTYTFNPQFVLSRGPALAPFGNSFLFDYRLKAISDAIDTGTNFLLPAPYNLDLDGNNRVMGPFPDLGAYEWNVCAGRSVSISLSGPATFCIQDSVLLTANTVPAANIWTYQWNNGVDTTKVITAKTTGNYKVAAVDTLGCRVTANINISAIQPNPTITRTGNTLSVPAGYATYQWFKNGVAIAGAAGSSFTVTSNGIYTVSVTSSLAGCQGNSPAYTVLGLAAGTIVKEDNISIYPNPSYGKFSLSLSDLPDAEIGIVIRNLSGQIVYSRKKELHKGQAAFIIDLSNEPKGIYVIGVETESFAVRRKVVIQ